MNWGLIVEKSGRIGCVFIISFIVASTFYPSPVEGQERTLKVGVILPLSGSLAEYGVAMRNGISLARSKTPDSTEDITFIFEDAQSGSQNAISAFNKLLSTDRVNIIYVFGVQFCQALAPLAEKRRIPLIAQCVNDQIGKDSRYVIRFMNHAGEYTQVTTDYLRKNGLKRLEVVTGEQSYIEDMYRVLEAHLQAGESLGKTDRYPATETDFRASITRLRNTPPDALGVYLMPGQIAAFYKQAREQRLNLPTFGVNTFESQTEINQAEGTMEGAVFPNHHVEESFRQRYLSDFGNDIQLTWAALAFEFTRVTQKLLPRLLSARDGEGIIKAFSSLPAQTGEAVGEFHFAWNKDVGAYFHFPLVLKRITGNRVVELR